MKWLLRKSTLFSILLFFFFLLFFLKSLMLIDPDLGWHLRMGQIILEQGIPKTDPFSYTMPSFPFVDHEWLTNVFLYVLYGKIGFTGLAIIYSLLALTSLLLVLPKTSLKFLIGPLILANLIALPFVGIRPQIETWVLFALLLRLILNQNSSNKWLFLLPALFLIWVNLHGGFALGIVTLFIYFLVQSIQIKKVATTLLLILLLSFLATFINPYGIRVWAEVWMQISDSSLRFTIMEWLPAIFRFDPSYLLFLCLSTLLVFKFRKHFKLFELTLFFILGLMGISSQRHLPLFTIIALPLLIRSQEVLYKEIKKLKFGPERLQIVLKVLFTIIIINSLIQIVFIFKDYSKAKEEKFYPKEAIYYLKTIQTQGNLFAPYDWGGYLIWNYPKLKFFIDGRMPSWRWKTKLSKESDYAYQDYRKIIYGEQKELEEQFNKYNIKKVLWFSPGEKSKTGLLDYILNLNNGFLKSLFGLKDHKDFKEKLEDFGFKQIYSDPTATIYQRK